MATGESIVKFPNTSNWLPVPILSLQSRCKLFRVDTSSGLTARARTDLGSHAPAGNSKFSNIPGADEDTKVMKAS